MIRQRALHHLEVVTAILVLCCCLIGCSSSTNAVPLAHGDGSPFSNARVVPTATSTPAGPANPQHLLVPVVGINAPVEAVGIAPSGDLATPTVSPWTDTGWYTGGPRPGEKGSAVIDGHLDRPGGLPAVFWRLREMHKGNEVDIVDSNGQTLRFRVTDVEYYAPQDAPIQLIFGNSSGKYLNLITCAGDWIPSQHQTTLRLVVYTTLITA